MATVEDDLNLFERDIRQYKIEYEQFFGGGKKRPPNETEWRIENMIKRYSDRGANMNFAQRFRYSNLTQTFVKYRDIFRKRAKQKEEGRVQRHYGAAAREMERERDARRAQAKSKTAGYSFSVTCSDPDHEKVKVEQLYTAFRRAQKEAGEKADSLTLASFLKFVRQKTEELKQQKQGSTVEYEVSVEGERVRLKARVKS